MEGMTPIFDEIRAADLVAWAERTESTQWQPSLVRQLALGSGATLRACRFLTHEQSNLAGWDGITDATTEGLYISEGISGWELSKRKYVVGKANEDFAVRLREPGEIDAATSTFVVVTLRQWPGRKLGNGRRQSASEHKSEWEEEQRRKFGWRRVRVLDATDLASMLARAPAVGIWLASIMGRSVRGARSLISHWQDVATLRSGLRPATFLAGRQAFVDALNKWVGEPASAFEARTYSFDDLRDVLAAWWATRADNDEVSRLSPVAVSSIEVWTYLARTESPLLLLADEGLELTPEQISAATAKGHFVIHRTSAARSRSNGSPLPPLHRNILSEELTKSGMNSQQAWRVAGEVAGSGTALKRILSGHSAEPPWAKSEVGSRVAPVLLLGAWDSSCTADRTRVAAVFQMEYSAVESLLAPWAQANDPLVRCIEYPHSVKTASGWVTTTEKRWRVVAREDAWRWLSPYLQRDHFDRFRDAAVAILGELNPRYDMPADQRLYANIHGAVPEHSHRLRRATGETLCLLSLRSATTSEATDPAAVAREIISEVFDSAADWRLWASLDYSLVFFAEAAPDIFLRAIEDDLKRDAPATLSLFNQGSDGVFGDHPHVEIMWALEALLWEKSTVMRVLGVLTELAARDTGGNTSPRPLGVLREAFLPWLPQCCLNVDERCRALDRIMAQNTDVGWRLLFALLPKTHDISSPANRPVYRDVRVIADPPADDSDYRRQVQHVGRRLVEAAGTDAKRWEQLIGEIQVLPTDAFEAVLAAVRDLAVILSTEESAQLWESLRREAGNHRYFSDADWAMPESDCLKLDAAATALEPSDPVLKNLWLFRRRDCFLPGTTNKTPFEDQERSREEACVSALREIFAAGGLIAVRNLVCRISEHAAATAGALADKFGVIVDDAKLLPSWLSADEPAISAFARGYANSRFQRGGWDWLLSKEPRNWPPNVFASLAAIFPLTESSWKQIESIGPEHADAYWRHAGPWMGGSTSEDGERAVNEFIQRGRSLAALECIHSADHWKKQIRPELSIQVLHAVRAQIIAAGGSSEGAQTIENLDAWALRRVFKSVQENSSLTPEQVGKVEEVEWFFLPLLKHHEGRPRLLLRRLARDPAFFVELLEATAWPEDLPKEQRTPVSANAKNVAESAAQLLEQNIHLPGSKEDGSIDEAEFRSWIATARQLARQKGYRKACEYRIGEFLLHSPVDAAGFWPCAGVCRLLSDDSSEEISRGFTVAIFNNQGWPGPLGHGRLMSNLSARRQAIQELNGFADKLDLEFPAVATLVRHAAQEQERSEKRLFGDDD